MLILVVVIDNEVADPFMQIFCVAVLGSTVIEGTTTEIDFVADLAQPFRV